MVSVQLRQKEYYDQKRKTRSERQITRYGMYVTKQHQDPKTIEAIGPLENLTIQHLGQDWDKRI